MSGFNCPIRCETFGCDEDLCERYKAYQQGRADKYKEITSKYMLLTEKQVEDIRADAIEDLFTRIKTYCRCNSCIGCRFLDDETCEIAVIKEQMKGESE